MHASVYEKPIHRHGARKLFPTTSALAVGSAGAGETPKASLRLGGRLSACERSRNTAPIAVMRTNASPIQEMIRCEGAEWNTKFDKRTVNHSVATTDVPLLCQSTLARGVRKQCPQSNFGPCEKMTNATAYTA